MYSGDSGIGWQRGRGCLRSGEAETRGSQWDAKVDIGMLRTLQALRVRDSRAALIVVFSELVEKKARETG